MHTLTIIKKDRKTLLTEIEAPVFYSKYNGERRAAQELWRAEDAKYDLTLKRSWE